MPTLNQLSVLPFENNLIANGLNKDDKSATVYDFSGGYNVLDFLVSKVSASKQVTGKDGIFYKPIMGVSTVQAQTGSTVLNGTTLRVNFTDPSYDKFRLNVVVTDGSANQTQGRVIGTGAGYIEMETTDGSAWNTATQFLAGTFPTAIFNAQIARGSGAMASLFEYPEYVANRTSIYRENVELFARDASETWVEYQGDFWYSAQDMIMMQRIARDMEWRAMFSKYGVNSAGTVGYNMGLFDSIKDPERGGVYRPLANLMTQGDFESFIFAVANRQNRSELEIDMMVGRGFLSRVQSFTSPYIQYAGSLNTFGGDTVKGIDVRQYSINGVVVNFYPAPILNDIQRFPALSTVAGSAPFTRLSYTGIVLDTGMYSSVGGSMLPAMEKIYFGNSEGRYYYVPGAIGSSLHGSNQGLLTGDFNLATNHQDSVSTGYYTDNGYDFMSYNMGLLEMAI